MEVDFVEDRWGALSERRLYSSVIVCQITGRLGLAWRGAVVVVVGHAIPKLKVAAFMAHPVRSGCCGANGKSIKIPTTWGAKINYVERTRRAGLRAINRSEP